MAGYPRLRWCNSSSWHPRPCPPNAPPPLPHPTPPPTRSTCSLSVLAPTSLCSCEGSVLPALSLTPWFCFFLSLSYAALILILCQMFFALASERELFCARSSPPRSAGLSFTISYHSGTTGDEAAPCTQPRCRSFFIVVVAQMDIIDFWYLNKMFLKGIGHRYQKKESRTALLNMRISFVFIVCM